MIEHVREKHGRDYGKYCDLWQFLKPRWWSVILHAGVTYLTVMITRYMVPDDLNITFGTGFGKESGI